MRLVFRFLAQLSLPVNHALGAVIGRLVFALSPRLRRRARENIARAALGGDAQAVQRLSRRNAEEIGKGATELAIAFFRTPERVAELVVEREGWEHVEQLRAAGRAIIFAAPHLGGYDIAGRYLWSQLPFLALYRPSKMAWFDDLLREGRNRGAADEDLVAPANIGGVRKVLKHLRTGGCTFVLPDHVPTEGEGEWVPFFGRPAYTMTLVGRLQEVSGAAVVFCYAERLPRGAGFRLHLRPLNEPLAADSKVAAQQVNTQVEALVRECPEQYLWSYNRYKHPAGAPPPPAAEPN